MAWRTVVQATSYSSASARSDGSLRVTRQLSDCAVATRRAQPGAKETATGSSREIIMGVGRPGDGARRRCRPERPLGNPHGRPDPRPASTTSVLPPTAYRRLPGRSTTELVPTARHARGLGQRPRAGPAARTPARHRSRPSGRPLIGYLRALGSSPAHAEHPGLRL